MERGSLVEAGEIDGRWEAMYSAAGDISERT